MANDNDKGKKSKAASKKGKKEPRNWAKIIIPLFLVLIMLGTVVAYVAQGNWSSRLGDNTNTNSNVRPFSNITDGLKLIPINVSNVRFANLAGDQVLSSYMNSNPVIERTLPPTKTFGAAPQQDMLAVYPAGYFGDFTEQFVSLTGFGSGKINSSYPAYDVNGQYVEKVNSMYYYSLDTKPVVSGRIENVASTLDVMLGSNASSYAAYSDLFDELKWKHISTGNMTLETVGKKCNYTDVDRYYAAVGPADPSNKSSGRLYSYVAVMHVDRNLTDNESLEFALYSGSMKKLGFTDYSMQVYDSYVIIEAKGTLDICVDDMQNRWSFLQYKLQA